MPVAESKMPSLVAKVEALRSFFGVPAEAPLIVAVQMMNEQMGIVGAGPMPKQVDNLVELIGVNVVSSGAATNFQQPAAVGVAVEAPADSSAAQSAASSAASSAAPSAASSAASKAPPAAPQAAPKAKAFGKRKAVEEPPQPPAKAMKQMDIRQAPAFRKLFVPKKMLQAAASATSEYATCN